MYGAGQFRQPAYSQLLFQERFRVEGGKFFDPKTMKATVNSDIGVKVFDDMRAENKFMPPGVESNNLVSALIAFSLFNAAILAEVFRGGLQAVPRHQYEGGAALGLSHAQVMVRIVIPQAISAALPGIVNHIVPQGEHLAKALQIAGDIAAAASRSVQMTKRAINRSFEARNMLDALEEGLAIDLAIEGAGSPDKIHFMEIARRDGLKAALAWRDARFPGRTA